MILKYNIPKQYKVSTNKIYSGVHRRKRKEIADFYHLLPLADCKQLKQITKKVNLKFEFYFKSRYLDSSNTTFIWKCLEDWLVKWGLLKDDTNKYIWEVSYQSMQIDKKIRKEMREDYVRIIII